MTGARYALIAERLAPCGLRCGRRFTVQVRADMPETRP
jgi:hypothetical protein